MLGAGGEKLTQDVPEGAAVAPPTAPIGYDLNLSIDYVMKMVYKIAILAHEGRLPETILKAERGVASCGRGS